MNTTDLFGSSQQANALTVLGGTALADTLPTLLKQAVVAAANNVGGGTGYGTMASQNADAVNITGGTLSNVTISSSFANGLTSTDQITVVSTPAEQSAGYLGVPQNSQSDDYTLIATDAGKHIFHPAGDANDRTFTIPANSSVAYPIGTAVTFINMSNTVTIAITSDTLTLAGAGSTGSRTLAAYGMATAIKITSTSWIISGTNLS